MALAPGRGLFTRRRGLCMGRYGLLLLLGQLVRTVLRGGAGPGNCSRKGSYLPNIGQKGGGWLKSTKPMYFHLVLWRMSSLWCFFLVVVRSGFIKSSDVIYRGSERADGTLRAPPPQAPPQPPQEGKCMFSGKCDLHGISGNLLSVECLYNLKDNTLFSFLKNKGEISFLYKAGVYG